MLKYYVHIIREIFSTLTKTSFLFSYHHDFVTESHQHYPRKTAMATRTGFFCSTQHIRKDPFTSGPKATKKDLLCGREVFSISSLPLPFQKVNLHSGSPLSQVNFRTSFNFWDILLYVYNLTLPWPLFGHFRAYSQIPFSFLAWPGLPSFLCAGKL